MVLGVQAHADGRPLAFVVRRSRTPCRRAARGLVLALALDGRDALPETKHDRRGGDEKEVPSHGPGRHHIQEPREAPDAEEVEGIEAEPPLAELDVAIDPGAIGCAHAAPSPSRTESVPLDRVCGSAEGAGLRLCRMTHRRWRCPGVRPWEAHAAPPREGACPPPKKSKTTKPGRGRHSRAPPG